jgi:hypothetical protein
MKPLAQLFSLKKTEDSQIKTLDENEDDREQIRITYYQSGCCIDKSNWKTYCFKSLSAKFIHEL